MLEFQAVFWDTNVSINKKYRYLNNETLVHYLNGRLDYLKPECDKLRAAANVILLSAGTMNATEYDERIRSIQRLLNSINRKCFSLPPYCLAPEEMERHHNQLFRCLNRHRSLYTDTSDCRGDDGELVHFLPISTSDLQEIEKYQRELMAANEDIQRTLAPYILWLEDIRRVRVVYAKLLTEFLHSKHAFLSPQEIAVQLESYWQQEDDGGKAYQHLGPPQPVSAFYEVFSPEDGSPIVAESYIFDNLGAFLYTDFFRGLKNNYLSQKCANCKEWFLLPHGQFPAHFKHSTPVHNTTDRGL